MFNPAVFTSMSILLKSTLPIKHLAHIAPAAYIRPDCQGSILSKSGVDAFREPASRLLRFQIIDGHGITFFSKAVRQTRSNPREDR